MTTILWIALGGIFIAPFVDRRNPRRRLHVDLAVLVVFGLPFLHFFRAGGGIWVYRAAIACAALGLGYLLVRMVSVGFRPRSEDGALVPLLPARWLAGAAVALALFHVVYAATNPQRLIDVGRVSVIGADRIVHDEGLYDGPLTTRYPNGNTYGPANYLVYVPFVEALPPTRTRSEAPAARAAALTFDLLTGLALFALGRRLRRGSAIGVALAYAWFSYPYSLFVAAHGLNDALVAFLFVAALLTTTSPAGNGAVTAVAAAVKFVPAVVAPLFATAGPDRWRRITVFASAYVAVTLLLFVPFVPDGGVRELYDRTLGFQAGRAAAGSVWTFTAALDPVQVVVRGTAAALALVVAFVPARKTIQQVAALAAAVLLAFELGLSYWIPSYVVWFAPFVFVALFLSTTRETDRGLECRRADPSKRGRTSAG
jgi:hypothetical protein